jgi:hypothetical protein
VAARPAGVFPWSVLVLLIYDYLCPFASIRVKEIVAEIVYGSELVQGSEGDGAQRRPSSPSARPEKRPENDRFYQTAET